MRVIRLFCIIICALYFIIGVAHSERDNLSYYRDYWNPVYHGKLLSYCLLYKKECGGNVADKYCKIMGYDSSSKSIIANNVGIANFIDADLGCKESCKGWNCNGFKLIRCIDKIKHRPAQSYYFRTKTFVLPRMNKYRIDWCYQNGKDCGRRVAHSFCRRMGFVKSTDYKIDTTIYATKALGNQKLCFGDECRAFSSITCYR